MGIDRRTFIQTGTGALLSLSGMQAKSENNNSSTPCMLKPFNASGFNCRALMTTGDAFNGYRPPGIMDGMGAWQLDEQTVRLFVNHELAADEGYNWKLENGTALSGARVSCFDIDRKSRQIVSAGNAIQEIRDRRGEVVTSPEQVNQKNKKKSADGLNSLCSAQGYKAGTFGFVNDVFFTHEEISAREDHPHGGSVWALDTRARRLWALPHLGRGSWENVTAVVTPDQDKPDGHIALIMGDDLTFGLSPLYLWIGRKVPDGDFPARNGLSTGQLYAWKSAAGDRDPQDWHGTGSKRSGSFVAINTRDTGQAGKAGYDPDGWLNDDTLRAQAKKLGAFMFSRPEDVHTNPANHTQVVLCSTGHGKACPDDEWGTIYRINVELKIAGEQVRASANIDILHDCDDFGDNGIRSADNVVWASDGMIYIHEDKANKREQFGGETGREASTWRLNPENPDDREVVAVIDRSIVLPADASDRKEDSIGAWECCGLIDVTSLFPTDNELLFITSVQAHSIRGGSLGNKRDLYQGGQLVMLSKQPG